MFGLDDWLAGFSDGASAWIVLAVALLLGLRHATDPDHVAAMTALVAGTRERAARRAAELGAAWGAGHALTLVAFGLPILLLERYLPERVQQGAETAVAVVIVYLAVRLLVRWRRGVFHVHEHDHGAGPHTHLHAARSRHRHAERTRLGVFGIGLVHGMGGSAGVGILLVAAIDSTALAVVSLLVLAAFTAVSMCVVSSGFGVMLGSRPLRGTLHAVAPVLGFASLVFGVWYGTAAWSLAPYPF